MSKMSMKLTAENVFEQFSQLVSTRYELSGPAKERFLNLCELVDKMDEEFGSENISMDISPIGIAGRIKYDIYDIEFEHGSSHPFFQGIKNADLVRFSNVDGELLRIEFVINDLWVKK